MKGRIKALFWLYRSKVNAKGLAPIYIRITKDKVKTEVATGVFAEPKQWDVRRGKIKGLSDVVAEQNNALEAINTKILRIINQHIVDGKEITPSVVKACLIGSNEKGLVECFRNHIERMNVLIGKDYTQSSIELYEMTLQHLNDFLLTKNLREVTLSSINYAFVEGFSDYLKTVKNNTTNTVIKKLQRLNRVINVLVRKGMISRNPLNEFKLKKEAKQIVYLNNAELKKVEEKTFGIRRLDIVKDLFIFSCYTSLPYQEVMNLKPENLKVDENGVGWIVMSRQKTRRQLEIPILSKAQVILNKYTSLETNYVFPRITNQKMNAYLKEIGDCTGIVKTLTFHVARKTFATTVTLLNGVSMETVSTLLGHTSLNTTTSSYAFISKEKILNEFKSA